MCNFTKCFLFHFGIAIKYTEELNKIQITSLRTYLNSNLKDLILPLNYDDYMSDGLSIKFVKCRVLKLMHVL